MVDQKMHEYMTACYDRSLSIVAQNKKLMERMAEVLLLKEYITREEFEQMMEDPTQIDVIIARYEAVQKKMLADAKKIIKN